MKTPAKKTGGARAKLRAHFLANVGRVMDLQELREVAQNQSDWERRVRELRTEEGYLILTHNDRSDLKPGQYLLESAKPQPAFSRPSRKATPPFASPSPPTLQPAPLVRCASPSPTTCPNRQPGGA